VSGARQRAVGFDAAMMSGSTAAFPPVFGGEAWSARRFLLFNLAWLVIFAVGASGLLRSRRPAWLVAYFLAIGGGIGNGLGHLALVGQRGGYFPGAYIAVMALVVGSVLLWNLLQWRETSPRTRLTTKMRAR
jgi:hypothetical protein